MSSSSGYNNRGGGGGYGRRPANNSGYGGGGYNGNSAGGGYTGCPPRQYVGGPPGAYSNQGSIPGPNPYNVLPEILSGACKRYNKKPSEMMAIFNKPFPRTDISNLAELNKDVPKAYVTPAEPCWDRIVAIREIFKEKLTYKCTAKYMTREELIAFNEAMRFEDMDQYLVEPQSCSPTPYDPNWRQRRFQYQGNRPGQNFQNQGHNVQNRGGQGNVFNNNNSAPNTFRKF
ncbi:hypothetical protein L596_019869 [Steinernema carpocapsae]|uniref:Uncharacterized protein n=1 Tax=Steinernema carpocapsae TaxID=34508 RepID=A0A4U5MSF6_STECR|nr:hypothetical protein L596_019869 [Steinernema carpocapsae]